VEDVDHTRGPAFSHLSMVLSAAIDGQGVALGRLSLAADDLAAGHLVCPFGPILDARFSYYMVTSYASADLPKVQHFREWILEEMAKTSEKQSILPA
ncbi:MAG: transcriptional regulator, partial [bacterium]|nr:transcriptional regulator [bacterium]